MTKSTRVKAGRIQVVVRDDQKRRQAIARTVDRHINKILGRTNVRTKFSGIAYGLEAWQQIDVQRGREATPFIRWMFDGLNQLPKVIIEGSRHLDTRFWRISTGVFLKVRCPRNNSARRKAQNSVLRRQWRRATGLTTRPRNREWQYSATVMMAAVGDMRRNETKRRNLSKKTRRCELKMNRAGSRTHVMHERVDHDDKRGREERHERLFLSTSRIEQYL